jgi:hypothetical protein
MKYETGNAWLTLQCPDTGTQQTSMYSIFSSNLLSSRKPKLMEKKDILLLSEGV